MKLALLGNSSLALKAGLFFDQIDANITWFLGDEHLDALFENHIQCWSETTEEIGIQKLKSMQVNVAFLEKEFSWDLWRENYFNPLVDFFGTRQSIKPYKVKSIAKRFLGRIEEISKKSRFYDLFRVIYELNPEEFIKEQKDLNPQTYEKLTEEFMNSLNASLEMYEDFDIVLDLRSYKEPNSLSPTGVALGESKMKSEKIHRGLEVLKNIPSDKSHEVAVVGSGEYSAEVILKLRSWLEDKRNTLFVISDEEDPFYNFLNQAQLEVKENLMGFIQMMESEYKTEELDYLDKLKEWEQLDDFVKVKKPKPPMPIPRLVFFSGHNVTAIDQLIDKKRLFLTLEMPDWRVGVRQQENNSLDLKTIGVDEVYVASGMQQDSVVHLRTDEQGYFSYLPQTLIFNEAKLMNENNFKKICDEIFKLFSPAATL